MDNIQAAILSYKLSRYSEVIDKRRKIAEIYHRRLKNCEQLILPPAPNADPNHFDVFQNYELQAENRNALKEFLSVNGVGTLIQWGGKAVHQFNQLGFSQVLPKTEKFFERCIMIPMNIFISDDDVHYICDQIISFYKK